MEPYIATSTPERTCKFHSSTIGFQKISCLLPKQDRSSRPRFSGWFRNAHFIGIGPAETNRTRFRERTGSYYNHECSRLDRNTLRQAPSLPNRWNVCTEPTIPSGEYKPQDPGGRGSPPHERARHQT